MAKLLDFLNKVIHKGQLPDNFNDKQVSSVANHSKEMIASFENMKDIADAMDKANKNLTDAKEKIRKAAIAKNAKEKADAIIAHDAYKTQLETLNKNAIAANAAHDKILKTLSKKYKLTNSELNDINDHVKNNADSLTQTSNITGKSFDKISKVAAGGFDKIISNSTVFFEEFAIIGDLMSIAFNQMEKLNEKMVAFNRSMSLGITGTGSYSGFDNYGNGKQGSLTSTAMTNAVTEDGLLNAFKGFAKGQSLGAEKLTGQYDNMQQFGVHAAQLEKFYGVEMGTINSITSNLVYNFGTKVKDLNKIFEDGKEAAIAAGISVRDYFERLKEASDQIGKHYISGGVDGLKKLALYAAKTGQTIDGVMSTTDKFSDFTKQYEEQNKAAAHAMNLTAQNMQRVWALGIIGEGDKADELFKGSLAKDIINNGMIDKYGSINMQGTRNLQQMGIGPDDIKVVQRMINMQKQYGITLEQFLHQDLQTAEVKAKIYAFEHDNLTMSEKLGKMWGRIRVSLIDPLTSILGPVLNILVDALGIIVDVIAPIFDALAAPLRTFGNVIKWIADEFHQMANYLGFKSESLDKTGNENADLNAKQHPIWNKFTEAIKFVTGSLMVLGIASLTSAAFQGIKSTIGGIGSRILGTSVAGASGEAALGSTFSYGMQSVGLLAKKSLGNMFPRATMGGMLQGGLIGAGIGIGGNILGNNIGGEAGNTVSTVSNWSGIGTSMGALAGPEGMAFGAALGALVGVGVASWDKIDKVWQDGSKSTWEHIIGSFDAVFQTLNETGNGIQKYMLDEFKKVMGVDDDVNKFNISPADMQKFYNGNDNVTNMMNNRKNQTGMAPEIAQEAAMNNVFSPTVNLHVTTSFDNSAKAMIAGR